MKTGDSQEPWVRIPLSPPPFSRAQENIVFHLQPCRSTQVAIRGSPAKGVVGLNRARVRIPPSAPARRKRHIACDEFFVFPARSPSHAHSAAPRVGTGPDAAGLRFGMPSRGRLCFLEQHLFPQHKTHDRKVCFAAMCLNTFIKGVCAALGGHGEGGSQTHE